MSDTIELLEAIGRDASLRHAPPERLADLLAEADAPGELTEAVALGSLSPIGVEARHISMHTLHATQNPGHDDEHDHDDEPDRDDDSHDSDDDGDPHETQDD